MLTKMQFNVLMVLGALALLLVIANGALFTTNRSEQAALGQRQQYVQQTVGLETLYREIVKSLADLAVKNNDRAILDMLGTQGISVTVNGPTPGEPASVRKAEK